MAFIEMDFASGGNSSFQTVTGRFNATSSFQSISVGFKPKTVIVFTILSSDYWIITNENNTTYTQDWNGAKSDWTSFGSNFVITDNGFSYKAVASSVETMTGYVAIG